MNRVLGATFGAALLLSCFKPSISDGAVACGVSGLCPPGLQCSADNLCRRAGSTSGDSTGDSPGGDGVPGDPAAGDRGSGDSNLGDINVPPALTVSPTYPGAPDWNDYIKNEVPSAPDYKKPGTPCDGSETGGAWACIHTGVHRRVDVTVLSNCQGLVLSDALGAFDWVCDDNGGAGPVAFFSTRLTEGKGLGDLVTPAGFAPNSVSLAHGAMPLASTAPAVWGWTNPVMAPPANPTGATEVLGTAAAIYVVDADTPSNGYNLDADQQAFVVLPGARLEYGDAPGDCSRSTGEYVMSGGDNCFIATGGQKFLWLEGAYGDGPLVARQVISMVNTTFSVLHNVTVTDGDSYGVRLQDSSFNRLTHVVSYLNTGEGIILDTRDRAMPAGSHYNVLSDIRVVSNDDAGIAMWHSDHNHFRRVTAANNRVHGLEMLASRYNLFVGLRVSNTRLNTSMARGNGIDVNTDGGDASQYNVFSGVIVTGSAAQGLFGRNNMYYSTVSHLTAINNGSHGFAPHEAVGLRGVQILSVNNDSTGVYLASPAGQVQMANVFLAHQGWFNIRQFNDDTMRFMDFFEWTEELWMDLADCHSGPVITNPGLVDGSCTVDGMEGSRTPSPSGNLGALLHIGRDLSSSLAEHVSTGDAVNPDDDAGGQAAHNSIADWTSFESPWRFWGRVNTNFPGSGIRGACVPSGNCSIFDTRILTADTQLRGVVGTFAPGAACPPSAHGDVALTDRVDWPYDRFMNAVEGGMGDGDDICEPLELCSNRFLINAQELLDDGVGDDDGLCESAESCVFSPNVGAYQGEGPLSPPCVFSDGAVRNVTLHALTVNGT